MEFVGSTCAHELGLHCHKFSIIQVKKFYYSLDCVCVPGNDYLEKAVATRRSTSVPCNLGFNPKYISAGHSLFY